MTRLFTIKNQHTLEIPDASSDNLVISVENQEVNSQKSAISGALNKKKLWIHEKRPFTHRKGLFVQKRCGSLSAESCRLPTDSPNHGHICIREIADIDPRFSSINAVVKELRPSQFAVQCPASGSHPTQSAQAAQQAHVQEPDRHWIPG